MDALSLEIKTKLVIDNRKVLNYNNTGSITYPFEEIRDRNSKQEGGSAW